MRRRPLFRVIAAALALWFGLNAAAPELLHACPVHSGTAADHGHRHAHQSSGAHAMPMSGHSGHTARTHLCSCPGDCCAATLQTLERPRFLAAAPAEIRVECAVVRQDNVPRPPASVAHVIPFANGPPTSA